MCVTGSVFLCTFCTLHATSPSTSMCSSDLKLSELSPQFGEIPWGGHDWLKHDFRWLNSIFDSASPPRDQGWGWITRFDLYGDLKLPRDFSTSHLSIQKTLITLQIPRVLGVVCQETEKTKYLFFIVTQAPTLYSVTMTAKFFKSTLLYTIRTEFLK